MEGAETELDKTILEAIRDPLTHIVRNSVDHGIESPEARIAKGKPAEGSGQKLVHTVGHPLRTLSSHGETVAPRRRARRKSGERRSLAKN